MMILHKSLQTKFKYIKKTIYTITQLVFQEYKFGSNVKICSNINRSKSRDHAIISIGPENSTMFNITPWKKKSGNINRRNYIGIREVILYKTIANIMLNVKHMIFSLKSGMITRVPIFFNLTQYNVQNFG